MTFLLAYSGLLFLGVGMSVAPLMKFFRNEPGQQHALVIATGLMAPGMLVSLPSLMERGAAASGSAWLAICMIGAGAVCGIGLYGGGLRRAVRACSGPLLAFTGLGLVLSIYMVWVAVDHLRFYGVSGTAAAVEWDPKASFAPDVECDSSVLVVRPSSKGSVYRCPTGLVLGRLSSRPVVPWPGYTEGMTLHDFKTPEGR